MIDFYAFEKKPRKNFEIITVGQQKALVTTLRTSAWLYSISTFASILDQSLTSVKLPGSKVLLPLLALEANLIREACRDRRSDSLVAIFSALLQTSGTVCMDGRCIMLGANIFQT